MGVIFSWQFARIVVAPIRLLSDLAPAALAFVGDTAPRGNLMELAVAARQMAARGRLLLLKIPRSLPAEYQGLVATTRDRLNTNITRFSEFAEGSASR